MRNKEWRNKISQALKGNKNGLGHIKSQKVKERISRARKERMQKYGYLNSPQTREKMSEAKKGKPAWNKGKSGYMSKEGRKRIGEAIKFGVNARNWIDGRSFLPYPVVFNGSLKKQIKERDHYTCLGCGVKEQDYFEKLAIHHLDYNKDNCSLKNLITLCRSCNSKANAKKYRERAETIIGASFIRMMG